MIQAPRNKAEFYRRYHAGEFGNRPKSWPDITALRESKEWNGGVISAMPHERGGRIHVAKPLERIRRDNGGTLRGLMFLEPVPHHANRLQGEVVLGPHGMDLMYSHAAGLSRRDACLNGNRAQGLRATGILRDGLYPSDFDWLMELFGRFPNAVIEFSSFNRFVGVIPRRNTIIWEVREY